MLQYFVLYAELLEFKILIILFAELIDITQEIANPLTR